MADGFPLTKSHETTLSYGLDNIVLNQTWGDSSLMTEKEQKLGVANTWNHGTRELPGKVRIFTRDQARAFARV